MSPSDSNGASSGENPDCPFCYPLKRRWKGTQLLVRVPRIFPKGLIVLVEARGGRIYAKITSKRRSKLVQDGISRSLGALRGLLLHRAAIWVLGGEKYSLAGLEVHHIDGDPLNCCPVNLVLIDPALHVHFRPRCPVTGKFLKRRSKAELEAAIEQEAEWAELGS